MPGPFDEESPAMPRYDLAFIEALSAKVLIQAGASATQAGPVARSVRRAEADGVRSHGLMYLPIYAAHLRCGKVLGQAVPEVTRPRPGTVVVDAGNGFAHPAIAAGLPGLIGAARQNGIAAMGLHRSYNCGVLGHHAEDIARAGMIGLCFTHAPASIAPLGGSVPVIGTNPVALAVPGPDGSVPFILDQSASVIAKSEVILRSRRGEALEEGWALDAEGRPTTDAAAALKGSMRPAGGAKGFGLGLIAEILASCLPGAQPSRAASPFSGEVGGPPATGQCLIALDPGGFAAGFLARSQALAEAITGQPGARLPGQRRMLARARIAQDGVEVDAGLMAQIEALIQ